MLFCSKDITQTRKKVVQIVLSYQGHTPIINMKVEKQQHSTMPTLG